jgi:hypothetical protein
MADTHVHSQHGVAHRSDARAAFAGLVIGVLALLLLVSGVVMLTNRHYANEKPAAAEGHR